MKLKKKLYCEKTDSSFQDIIQNSHFRHSYWINYQHAFILSLNIFIDNNTDWPKNYIQGQEILLKDKITVSYVLDFSSMNNNDPLDSHTFVKYCYTAVCRGLYFSTNQDQSMWNTSLKANA